MDSTNVKVQVERQALPADRVPLLGMIAQSVATIAPSFAIFLGISIVIGISGNGSWLSFAIATVAMLAVALCVRGVSRSVRSAGGLYGMSAAVGGPVAGVFAAWGSLLFYVILGLVAFLGSGLIAARFVGLFGPEPGTWFVFLVGLAVLAASAFVAYRDIVLSARIMLYIELVSLAAIGLLMTVALFHSHGSPFDSKQLSLKHVSLSQVVDAVVFAVASFAGFESSSTLGSEARDPGRSVGISVVSSVIVAGVAYILSSYIMLLGFHHAGQSVAKSADPMSALAGFAGISWIRYIVVLGVLIGAFSFALAALNATSRFLMTLSHDGVLPTWIGGVSSKTGTPAPAVALLAGLYLVALVVFGATGNLDLNQFGYLATLFGYGAILLYFILCLAYIRHQYTEDRLHVGHVLLGLIGAGVLAFVIYKSAVPEQAPPYNYILFAFFGVFGIAAVQAAYLYARRSPVLTTIGSSAERNDVAAVTVTPPAATLRSELAPEG